MVIKSKTDAKNKRLTKHMVVVKFLAFGENKPNVPQRHLEWQSGKDCKVRVMIVPVEEDTKDQVTVGFLPTMKSGEPLKDVPLDGIIPITPDVQLRPIGTSVDSIQTRTVELFDIGSMGSSFDALRQREALRQRFKSVKVSQYF